MCYVIWTPLNSIELHTICICMRIKLRNPWQKAAGDLNACCKNPNHLREKSLAKGKFLAVAKASAQKRGNFTFAAFLQICCLPYGESSLGPEWDKILKDRSKKIKQCKKNPCCGLTHKPRCWHGTTLEYLSCWTKSCSFNINYCTQLPSHGLLFFFLRKRVKM